MDHCLVLLYGLGYCSKLRTCERYAGQALGQHLSVVIFSFGRPAIIFSQHITNNALRSIIARLQ